MKEAIHEWQAAASKASGCGSPPEALALGFVQQTAQPVLQLKAIVLPAMHLLELHQ